MLLSLPLSGVRTFDDLAFLAPGVAPPPQAIGNTTGPGLGPGVGTSGQFAVNGLRSRANGLLTLILPIDLRTRRIEYAYRPNLNTTRVTSRCATASSTILPAS